MTRTVEFDTMTARAKKAFDTWSGDKARANLPTETQDALLTLETFIKLFARVVSADAPITARQRAIVAMRDVI